MPRWLHRSYYRAVTQADCDENDSNTAPQSAALGNEPLPESFITNVMGSQPRTLIAEDKDTAALCIQIMFDLNAQKHSIASLETQIRELAMVPKYLRQALQNAEESEELERNLLRNSMGSLEIPTKTQQRPKELYNYSNSSLQSTNSKARSSGLFRDFYERSFSRPESQLE